MKCLLLTIVGIAISQSAFAMPPASNSLQTARRVPTSDDPVADASAAADIAPISMKIEKVTVTDVPPSANNAAPATASKGLGEPRT
jgi:hypothetical protein